MEHTYLLRPGKWRAEGTYYDDAGRAFPLTGRSELTGDGPERRLTGWMEVAAPQPLRFANDYVIRETDRPFALAWESRNPALGVLEGTFELAGESILSRNWVTGSRRQCIDTSHECIYACVQGIRWCASCH